MLIELNVNTFTPLHCVTAVVHAGNIADLSFGPVVAGTNALMLVSTHLDSVAQVTFDRVGDEVRRTELIPAEAFKQCAFFRVWCLVELAEALSSKKAVVMVVGKQSADGFRAIPGVLDPLWITWLLFIITDACRHAGEPGGASRHPKCNRHRS